MAINWAGNNMFSNNGFNNLNPYTDLKLLNEAKKHSDKSRY